MSKKATAGRIFIEIAVIFSSVVLAFFFEDYREEQNEISKYIETLSAFRLELISEIEDRTNEVDSFRIDSNITGRQFERHLLLQALDSLISSKTMSKAHYQFMISSGVLNIELFGRYDPSPLADEIMAKHSEHIKNKQLVAALSSYKENIINIKRGEDAAIATTRKLEAIIMETDPQLSFNEMDLKLLSSNKFIWNFHNLAEIKQGIYLYNQYLSQDKLISVLDVINAELENFRIPIEKNSCIREANFRKRSECYEYLDQEKEITSIVTIAKSRLEEVGSENQ